MVTWLTYSMPDIVLYFFFSDCIVSAQGDTVYATVVPEVDEKELEQMVNPIVQEYFEHGDTKEVQVNNQKLSNSCTF